MLIKIVSFRGHHEAEVETVVAEAVFDKLSGKTKTPLPEEFKSKVPATFQELEGLWKEGKMNFSLFRKNEEEELVGIKEFNPELQEIDFLAPQTGG